MPYEPNIDVATILGATLRLLENSQYPQKHSASVEALIDQIRQCIAEIEAAKIPPAREEANSQASHASRDGTRSK